jgi:hypothetical protein
LREALELYERKGAKAAALLVGRLLNDRAANVG